MFCARLIRFLAGLLLLVLCLSLPARASTFDDGVKAYNQHNYRLAVQKFEQVWHASKANSTCLYYLAIAYQALGNVNKARSCYQELLARFPGTAAAGLAAKALGLPAASANNQAGQYPHMENNSPWAAGAGAKGQAQVQVQAPVQAAADKAAKASDLQSLPDHARVYFRREGGELLVSSQVEDRPLTMIFDTSAPYCNLGLNNLREMGIPVPTGPPQGEDPGVGGEKPMKYWFTTMNIKLGALDRHNVKVKIDENVPNKPILGQTFFGDLKYTIDYAGNAINFTKGKPGAQAASAKKKTNDVPFTREGQYIIVTAQVNGRSCNMILDTGLAGGSVSFTRDQLSQAGINLPEDAARMEDFGTSGWTRASTITLARLKLGPIEKTNVDITIPDRSSLEWPLLGQSFLSGWQYQIDDTYHVIHFSQGD